MEKIILRRRLLTWARHLPFRPGKRDISNGFSDENDSKVKKKDISIESMAPNYNPSLTEKGWYDWWESKGYFKPRKEEEVFAIILPPPNVTGTLHLGHALTLTIQDVFVRWMKMKGENVLWIPGFDHAGIATQLVVEKYLQSVSNVTKHDLGKKEFLMKVVDWKIEKENAIIQQMRQLGASVDWSRKFFTMDGNNSGAVINAFIHLYNKGLIYRRNGQINWSCYLKSAVSGIEVEKREIDQPCNINVPGYEKPVNFGYMYKFAYKIWEDGKEVHEPLPQRHFKIGLPKFLLSSSPHHGASGAIWKAANVNAQSSMQIDRVAGDSVPSEELVIASTRPETILGDTAVAVHPDDTRYSHLKNKFVWHPFRKCKIPIVFDESVNPEQGTGVLKVTPAHSEEDLEIAKRHNLEVLDVIDENGLIKDVDCFGQFQGMKRFDARRRMLNELQNLGVYHGRDKHAMVIPICSRSGDVIEYLIKPQWFLRCAGMYEKVRTAIMENVVTIEPEVCKEKLLDWISRNRDWNLSRQIWLGHRIPIYNCKSGRENFWIAASSLDEARSLASDKFKSNSTEVEITQDPDVLDTWFSSALLPLSLSGWPHQIRPFYPFGLMETGRDIVFFWVARMLMIGLEISGMVPFNRVVLHGLVCDSLGRKMSKSLGNVVLPEDVVKGISLAEMKAQSEKNCQLGLISPKELKLSIEGQKKMFPSGIPECGADALRFTLCNDIIKGENLNFSIHVCQANRFFCNKIWQALKFFIKNVENRSDFSAKMSESEFLLFDAWILSSLAEVVESVNRGIGDFQYHLSVQAIRNFFVKRFCDIYIESCKPVFSEDSDEDCRRVASIMFNCFETILRLMSPFMPFVTEELYHCLPKAKHFVPPESITVTEYPDPSNWVRHKNPKVDEQMSKFLDILYSVRSLRSIYKLSGQKLKVILSCSSGLDDLFSDEIRTFLKWHASVHEFTPAEGAVPERNVIKIIDKDFTVYLYHEHSKDTLQRMFGSVLTKEHELREHFERLKSAASHPDYENETPEMKQKNLLTLTHLAEELNKIKEVREVIEKAEAN